MSLSLKRPDYDKLLKKVYRAEDGHIHGLDMDMDGPRWSTFTLSYLDFSISCIYHLKLIMNIKSHLTKLATGRSKCPECLPLFTAASCSVGIFRVNPCICAEVCRNGGHRQWRHARGNPRIRASLPAPSRV